MKYKGKLVQTSEVNSNEELNTLGEIQTHLHFLWSPVTLKKNSSRKAVIHVLQTEPSPQFWGSQLLLKAVLRTD